MTTYEEKQKLLVELLFNLRSVEEEAYILIETRSDLDQDLILARHGGLDPADKSADSIARRIGKVEELMDKCDSERKTIYSKLESLRTKIKVDYSNINTKLLTVFSENMSTAQKEKFAAYVFRQMANRSKGGSVDSHQFIVALVNTKKFTWSVAQEILERMNDHGLIYEIKDNLYRLTNSASPKSADEFL